VLTATRTGAQFREFVVLLLRANGCRIAVAGIHDHVVGQSLLLEFRCYRFELVAALFLVHHNTLGPIVAWQAGNTSIAVRSVQLPRAGLAASQDHKKGLCFLSQPMVVGSPWPGYTTTWSGSSITFCTNQLRFNLGYLSSNILIMNKLKNRNVRNHPIKSRVCLSWHTMACFFSFDICGAHRVSDMPAETWPYPPSWTWEGQFGRLIPGTASLLQHGMNQKLSRTLQFN
jgi:hypothetical protein